jgi:hypothetical protein
VAAGGGGGEEEKAGAPVVALWGTLPVQELVVAVGWQLETEVFYARVRWSLWVLGASLRLQAKATSSNLRKLGLRVRNANTQCEGSSAVFCRKSETSEFTRRLGRVSREEVFEGTKTEDAKAATCPQIIGGQQGSVLM